MSILSESSQSIQSLGFGCYAAVSPTHRFGTDAFLLSDFACPKKTDIAADLGTGCGIIPLLWRRKNLCASITGLELQQDGAELAQQGIELSNAQEIIKIINGDMKNHRQLFISGSFDLVSCNPPYKAMGAGLLSATQPIVTVRHEHSCTLQDVCAAASFMLRYGGRFVLCHRPERLTDILCTMRANQIEPKRIRFVHQRTDQQPWLVLVEGRRGGRTGVTINSPFYMEDTQGNRSQELQTIYKGWDNG